MDKSLSAAIEIAMRSKTSMLFDLDIVIVHNLGVFLPFHDRDIYNKTNSIGLGQDVIMV